MNKIKILLLFILIGIYSCQNSKKELNNLEIAKKYYVAIGNSNPRETTELITEQFTTIDDGFEQTYSKTEYSGWVKWDSVFQPTYKILKIQEENGIVKAKISKTDIRISFLHHEPIVTDEIIQFKDNKIQRITRTSSLFVIDRFIKNRDNLVHWIEVNHPELIGFLNDQTKKGGMNYLKAIELYNNQN